MQLEYIFLTFGALAGGRLIRIAKAEDNLSLVIEHPALANLHKEGSTKFHITLRAPYEIAFEMADEMNTIMVSLREIEKLQLTLQPPHRFTGGEVRIPCGMNDHVVNAGNLILNASAIRIFDEEFDAIRPDEMAHLEYLLSNRQYL